MRTPIRMIATVAALSAAATLAFTPSAMAHNGENHDDAAGGGAPVHVDPPAEVPTSDGGDVPTTTNDDVKGGGSDGGSVDPPKGSGGDDSPPPGGPPETPPPGNDVGSANGGGSNHTSHGGGSAVAGEAANPAATGAGALPYTGVEHTGLILALAALVIVGGWFFFGRARRVEIEWGLHLPKFTWREMPEMPHTSQWQSADPSRFQWRG